MTPGWRFDNSYSRLPEALYVRVHPVSVPNPHLAVFNHALARDLGIDDTFLATSGQNELGGNSIPKGAEPLAQAYAGHQFGHFTMLGDGRAVLLGEHITPSGVRFDIQLKGSGQTPFSRRGDGRAAIGPMLREYIISEAMHALGIPTTRSLAVVETGNPVFRDKIERGAILTRVASSHIRVGTFEYAARSGEGSIELLRSLADYTINRHYPNVISAGNPYLDFFREVCNRQAELVARWMQVGFIHGVMNTDNMAISGETIDYGPCAFMDTYHEDTVFSSIDHSGRYAYRNQPLIAQWNLSRLGEALLPLLAPTPEAAVREAREVLEQFPDQYEKFWLTGYRQKLGLTTAEHADSSLIKSLLALMQESGVDYTNTFRELSETSALTAAATHESFGDWLERWLARLSRESHCDPAHAQRMMQTKNPVVIPRNHLVEHALRAAGDHGDFSIFNQLITAVTNPFDTGTNQLPFRKPPSPEEEVKETFCGT